MPVFLDKGDLMMVGSRMRAFMDGPLAREIMNEVSVTIMPGLVSRALGKAGVSIMTDTMEHRVVPAITGGAGGVSASFSIPFVKGEVGDEALADGRFPVVRRGNMLQMMVPENQEEEGAELLGAIKRNTVSDEEIEALIYEPLRNAFWRAMNQ